MKNLLIFCLIALFFSCHNEGIKDINAFKNVKQFNDEDFEEQKVYSNKQYSLLYKINDIIVKDSILIVCTTNKKAPVSLLNKYSFVKISEGGCYGNGPGEQLYFYNLSNINNSSKFWVSDIITKRITRYDTYSLIMLDTNYHPRIQLNLNKEGKSIYSPIMLTNKIIGPSMDGIARLYIFDLQGNLLSKGGVIPLKKNEQIPDDVNANAYYGRFDALKNDKNKVLLVKINMFSPIVEFYNEKGEEKVTLLGPEQFTPKYTVGNAGGGNMAFAPDKEIRIANSDVYLSDNFVYTLYSGKQDNNDSPAVNCNLIYQFDWKGNCYNKYILDKEVICFYVDETAKYIYGGAADGYIYRFPIN